MRKTLLIGLLGLIAATPATRPSQPSYLPAPKMNNGKVERGFTTHHEAFLKRRTTNTRLLFIGASIVEFWQVAGKDQYARFAKFDVDNFGISGDTTQNVLWRIDNGELDGMSPEVVMVHAGNNNLDNDTADEVVRGITAVIDQLHKHLPNSKIILMALFPRGVDPEDPKVAAMREKIRLVNAQLMKLDDGDKTRILAIGDKFLEPNGTIRYGMMHDAMHPTDRGYKIWADELLPVVEKLMKPKP